MIVLEIPWTDPIQAAAALADQPRLALLDSAMTHERLGRWSYLAASPFGVFQVEGGVATWNGTVMEEPPMAALRGILARHARSPVPGAPPFTGGAIGAIAYEAGHLFEKLPVTPAATSGSIPQIDLPFYDRLIAFDTVEHRAFAIAPDEASALHLCGQLERVPQQYAPPVDLLWRDSRSRSAYEAEVARIIAYIREGDIFQANLSHRFSATPEGYVDPLATYRAVRQANPAPFSALLVDGKRFIASTSPERFLRLDDGMVEARPIKGTKRRTSHAAMDVALAQVLEQSEKDRAENVMIVDLLRNDLSRVCEPGSVKVPVLCGIETYASVHHLTSVITGRMKGGRDIADLIAATFPGGSITGAPKIRAMEIIAELEKEERGIYCGAIGWIGFDGAADLNIAIRTLTFDGTDLSVRAGGGITLLSEPFAEYEETLAKADRLLGAFTGPAREEAAA